MIMAMKCKTLMRPKVRFIEQSDSTEDSDICIETMNKPKISSIINLDGSVRLIDGVSTENLADSNKKNVREEAADDLSMVKIGSTPLISYVLAPCLTEINASTATISKPKIISTNTCKQKSIKPSIGSLNKDRKSDGTRQCNLNTKNNREFNKENVKITRKSLSSQKSQSAEGNKKKPVLNLKLQMPVTLLSASQLKATNAGQPNDALSRDKLPVIAMKKRPKSITKQSQRSQVRSEMVKNICGRKPNVYVGPGISRNRIQSLSSTSEEHNSKINTISSNKLDRPQYNSIINEIKKFEEVKKEKINTHINKLPMNYRNLCLKKMSCALDFPSGESIFHDLIDLSITEKELPLRLIRSKDPEPREKDLQPHLSDFFLPQNDGEYVESVKIRPKSPKIVDNLYAFKISDRIFCWKTCLNEI